MANPTDLFSLHGKTAMVTGASSGLGRHFALTLAKAGAKVAIAARRTDRLSDLAEEIASFDGRAVPVALDVADGESVRAAVRMAATELGPLSILVNNAGIASTAPALKTTEADWDRVVDTNLKGSWLMAQEFARHAVDAGQGGSIVNIASILGLGGIQQVPAYAASKAGLINLTRALAVEWARHGIRVNAICPGYVETDINSDFLNSDIGKQLQKRIPQRRFGQAQDLDGPLLLLASEASAHMTGSLLTVDGGHSVNL